MPRKPKEAWHHHFSLDQADTNEALLHEHLSKLSEKGRARDWIVQTLLAALDSPAYPQAVPSSYSPVTRQLPQSDLPTTRQVPTSNPPVTPEVHKDQATPPKTSPSLLPKPTNGALSPADVIAERKRLAAQKHPGMPSRKGD